MMAGNLEIDELTLLSGSDVYSPELGIVFHQPKLKDIAVCGMEIWQTVLNLFLWEKSRLTDDLQKKLTDASEFECIYLMLQDKKKDNDSEYYYDHYLANFSILVFPQYNILVHQRDKPQLVFEDKETQEIHVLNKNNYDIFIYYINTLFFSENGGSKGGYNVDENNILAKQIKAKLEKRNKILATRAKNNNSGKHSVLYNMISSLALDTPSGLNEIFDLTLYQFYEQVGRYHKKVAYDSAMSAMLVGAQGIELETWYEDI